MQHHFHRSSYGPHGLIIHSVECWCWAVILLAFCESRLYVNGVNVNPMALYPPVNLPVSSSTPMLSSLIHWDHSSSWEVPTATQFLALNSSGSGNSSASSVEVNVSSPDSEDAYLTGHVIDGRVLFPATGYLVLAWRQLARMNSQTYQQTPVSFDDVHIHRATILPSSGKSVHCYYDVRCFLIPLRWMYTALCKNELLTFRAVGYAQHLACCANFVLLNTYLPSPKMVDERRENYIQQILKVKKVRTHIYIYIHNKIKHQSLDDAYSSKLMWTISAAAVLNIKTDFNTSSLSLFRNDINAVCETLLSDKKTCV